MDVHSLLRQSDAAEFPVVESEASLLLIGSVPRHGLEQLLAKQLLNPTRSLCRRFHIRLKRLR